MSDNGNFSNGNGQQHISHGGELTTCSWPQCAVTVYKPNGVAAYCDWCRRFVFTGAEKRERHNMVAFYDWRQSQRLQLPRSEEHAAYFVKDSLWWQAIKGEITADVLQKEILKTRQQIYADIEALGGERYLSAIWQHNLQQLAIVLESRKYHSPRNDIVTATEAIEALPF